MQHRLCGGRKVRKRGQYFSEYIAIEDILLGVSWNTVLDFPAPYLFFRRYQFEGGRIFDFTHYKQTVSTADVFQRSQFLH